MAVTCPVCREGGGGPGEVAGVEVRGDAHDGGAHDGAEPARVKAAQAVQRGGGLVGCSLPGTGRDRGTGAGTEGPRVCVMGNSREMSIPAMAATATGLTCPAGPDPANHAIACRSRAAPCSPPARRP